MMREKKDNNCERNEYLYHNTELLLKKYREVVFSIEIGATQAEYDFESEMCCKLDEYLEMSHATAANFEGTKIVEQMRIMERNKKMLSIIDRAINIIKDRVADGEEYYWILYYTYISDKPSKRVEDIIALVSDKTEPMSWKTYFNKRKRAIEKLSDILWGFTSKECIGVLNMYLGEK